MTTIILMPIKLLFTVLYWEMIKSLTFWDVDRPHLLTPFKTGTLDAGSTGSKLQESRTALSIFYKSISIRDFAVFVVVNTAVKMNEKLNLREKGFISLIHMYSSSSKAARVGTQIGQKPWGRSLCRGHRRVMLTPMLCSACFLTEAKTTRKGGPTLNGLGHLTN